MAMSQDTPAGCPAAITYCCHLCVRRTEGAFPAEDEPRGSATSRATRLQLRNKSTPRPGSRSDPAHTSCELTHTAEGLSGGRSFACSYADAEVATLFRLHMSHHSGCACRTSLFSLARVRGFCYPPRSLRVRQAPRLGRASLQPAPSRPPRPDRRPPSAMQ